MKWYDTMTASILEADDKTALGDVLKDGTMWTAWDAKDKVIGRFATRERAKQAVEEAVPVKQAA